MLNALGFGGISRYGSVPLSQTTRNKINENLKNQGESQRLTSKYQDQAQIDKYNTAKTDNEASIYSDIQKRNAENITPSKAANTGIIQESVMAKRTDNAPKGYWGSMTESQKAMLGKVAVGGAVGLGLLGAGTLAYKLMKKDKIKTRRK